MKVPLTEYRIYGGRWNSKTRYGDNALPLDILIWAYPGGERGSGKNFLSHDIEKTLISLIINTVLFCKLHS